MTAMLGATTSITLSAILYQVPWVSSNGLQVQVVVATAAAEVVRTVTETEDYPNTCSASRLHLRWAVQPLQRSTAGQGARFQRCTVTQVPIVTDRRLDQAKAF
jgi:hypothetical protein